MRPALLRPPDLLLLSVSERSGAPLCYSLLTTLTTMRRPGEVGLVVTIALTNPFYLVLL